MLNPKYTTIDRVLEKVYAEHGFKGDLEWTYAIELIGDAMDFIGVPSAYEDKITGQDDLTPTIKVENYRGELPCDLHLIVQTREYCTQTPMRYSTDTFHTAYHVDRSLDFTVNTDLTYTVNNNYIFTSFEGISLNRPV